MKSFNKVILVGRLVADPEERMTPSGSRVVRFRIAVDRRRRQAGNDNGDTDFFNIFSFNENIVNFVSTYLTKGRLILVEGELRSNRWTDRMGQKRTTYEIYAYNVVPLDRKPEGPAAGYISGDFASGDIDVEENLEDIPIDIDEEIKTSRYEEEIDLDGKEEIDLNEEYPDEDITDEDEPPF